MSSSASQVLGNSIHSPQWGFQGAAEAFARYTEGNAHVIICGRNEAAAQRIIDSLPKHPGSKYEFIQCDVSRVSNVAATCKALKDERGLTKLNYLFMR